MTKEEVLQLSEAERKRKIDECLELLKMLTATPQSDWHAGFEALLRLDARNAIGGTPQIEAEHRLGAAPPRVDFLVWLQEEGTYLPKEIYRIFRKFNIIEYKNPHDKLNQRVLHKAIGYAHLYAGLAEHEDDRPVNQITISIFRALKNPELFKQLEEAGQLTADEVRGIYHVTGLTEFPMQVVIMTELMGDEYAGERALVDNNRANVEDIYYLLECAEKATDTSEKEHYRIILDLIESKNPETMEKIRRDNDMARSWLEILKPDLTERDKERDKNNLFSFVQAGGMTLEFAAQWMNMPAEKFAQEMKEAGFKVPAYGVSA